LCQNLSPGRLIHIFIHSGHSNPTFGTTYPLTALLSPSRVTILLAQFGPKAKAETEFDEPGLNRYIMDQEPQYRKRYDSETALHFEKRSVSVGRRALRHGP
ncbi:MAG: hypothetical protein NTW03_16210, partial [Verrucomicrobia bacterium]|nr:hypothetical protein [Verrucomicrobiota bacterium]